MKFIETILETPSDKIELHECETCHMRWHHCTSAPPGMPKVEYWQRAKGKGCEQCAEYDGKATSNPPQQGG